MVPTIISEVCFTPPKPRMVLSLSCSLPTKSLISCDMQAVQRLSMPIGLESVSKYAVVWYACASLTDIARRAAIASMCLDLFGLNCSASPCRLAACNLLLYFAFCCRECPDALHVHCWDLLHNFVNKLFTLFFNHLVLFHRCWIGIYFLLVSFIKCFSFGVMYSIPA